MSMEVVMRVKSKSMCVEATKTFENWGSKMYYILYDPWPRHEAGSVEMEERSAPAQDWTPQPTERHHEHAEARASH